MCAVTGRPRERFGRVWLDSGVLQRKEGVRNHGDRGGGGGQIEMHGRGREEGDGSDWWDLDPCGSGGGRRFVRNT